MHFLIATSSYPLRPDDAFAAAGLFVRDFALELAHRGHRVTVLTHERPGEVVADPGLTVIRHPAPPVTGALARLRVWDPLDILRGSRLVASGARATRQLMSRDPADHILAMWTFPAGLYALSVHRRHGVPYSVWVLGSDMWSLARLPGFRPVIRRILHHAEQCFADGLALGRATASLSGRPCHFLPSARSFCDGPLPPVEWERPGFQFLFIGRLEANKGPDILVQAAAILRDRGPEFAVTMFGDGTRRRQVLDLIARYRLEDRVSVRGWAPPELAQAHLQACDAVVIPSRRESIPVIFSDALRAGAPLVVTDAGDMGELVRQHQLGLVASPQKAPALAAAMAAALRADRQCWQANAKHLAPSFSVPAAAAAFLQATGAASHRTAALA